MTDPCNCPHCRALAVKNARLRRQLEAAVSDRDFYLRRLIEVCDQTAPLTREQNARIAARLGLTPPRGAPHA